MAKKNSKESWSTPTEAIIPSAGGETTVSRHFARTRYLSLPQPRAEPLSTCRERRKSSPYLAMNYVAGGLTRFAWPNTVRHGIWSGLCFGFRRFCRSGWCHRLGIRSTSTLIPFSRFMRRWQSR